MSAEVHSIEGPYEDPVRDWRRSFRKMLDSTREQIRLERSSGSKATYDCEGQIWRAFELTDDEIEIVARAYATRMVERSIREAESEQIERRVKRRQGQAM